MEQLDGIRVARVPLERIARAILAAAGADDASAEATARAMADASARGFDTHGIRLLPFYVAQLEGGRVKGAPVVTVERPAPAVAIVDGDDGLGHAPSFRAVEVGMDVAAQTGAATVAVRRSSHHGATGCYTIEAARRGFVAFGCTNADPMVVPHGATAPFFGTNPVSFAAPLPSEDPLLLDMATSAIPMNRVFLRRDTGTALPDGVAVDAGGAPTTDPAAAAALMPLGGHDYGYKGAGLSMMVEMLCAAFTGMAHSFRHHSLAGPDFAAPIPIGHFFLVLRPGAFRAEAGWAAAAGEIVRDLRGRPAHPDAAAQAPGDPEKREAAARAAAGIPIDGATWDRIRHLARAASLDLSDI